MSATPATAALDAAQVSYRLHSYHHDRTNTNYGAEAATALGIDPLRMFKTLVIAVGQGRPPLAVAVVPVARRLDPKRFAAALGAKRAELAQGAAVVRATGYVLGGVSPLGQKTQLPTVLDESVANWDTIFVSAGRRGLDAELSWTDLVQLTNASLAEIAI